MHKALREGLPVLANIESYFQLGLLGFWSLNEILIELDWIDIEDSPAMHKRKGKKKTLFFGCVNYCGLVRCYEEKSFELILSIFKKIKKSQTL